MADRPLSELVEEASRASTQAEYHRVARAVDGLSEESQLVPLRLALLATASLEFLQPFLKVEGLRRGYRVECYVGGFAQFETELADPGAPLYLFEPDLLVLSLQPEELIPGLRVRFVADGGSRFTQAMEDAANRLVESARRFRAETGRLALIANHPVVDPGPLGPFDAADPDGYVFALTAANHSLATTLAQEPGVTVWDYAGLVRNLGGGAGDARLWALGRIPLAAANQATAAAHLLRTVQGLIRPPAKCLVLDLDNTLWGGVVGDDGLQGIQLGDDFPGNTYKALQHRVLGLADRGILIALVSKNEFESVDAAFRDHPDMVLRWEDVAAHRINWEPKSGNLIAIAEELNIGLDAMVLFDDNPVERAEVRANAPQVGVIDVPTDSTGYVAALDACEFFDQPTISHEDRARTELYRKDRQRNALRAGATGVEEFLASLDMVASVGVADDGSLNRIAQLVNKTNQFNLTTRRHSQSEIDAIGRGPDGAVLWLRLRDRFGDQGLVGVAIVVTDGPDALIDSFLMSCRVMNRHVEHALLAYAASQARAMGAQRLIGEYRPTAKNRVVEGSYPAWGFAPMETFDDGSRRYVLDLSNEPPWPEVIARG